MGTKRICIDVPSELAMADEIRIRLKRYMGKKQEGGSFR